eukprot:c39815_g1_i1 orf=56-307(+)
MQDYSWAQPHLVNLLVLHMPYFDKAALQPLPEFPKYNMPNYEDDAEDDDDADLQHPLILLITPQHPTRWHDASGHYLRWLAIS